MIYRSFFIKILSIAVCCIISSSLEAQTEPPFKLPEPDQINKIRSAVIFTNKGTMYIRLFPEDAPWHVANFKYLADKGFYKNMKFHIHERDYVIQTGAPGEKANSGPGYTLPPEFNQHKHLSGTLSMVRRPNDLDIEHTRRSHGSQFRIILSTSPHMDGQFTIFGKIIKGIAVAKKLRRGDIIKNIIVFVKDDEEKDL